MTSQNDLPTMPESELEWPTQTIRSILKMAIPPADMGSRGAIQYAHEIAEFLYLYGIEIRPGPRFNRSDFEAGIRTIDAHDTSLMQ